MEDEIRTIIKEERYKIANINHLCIGDEMYLDHIEEKTATKGEKDLCYIKPVNSVACEVDIKEVNTKGIYEDMELDFNTFEITIYCADILIKCGSKEEDKKLRKAYLEGKVNAGIKAHTERTINMMRNDRYFVKFGEPKYYELGCDAANFVICTNKDKSVKFDTGSDGYYGTVVKHPENVGLKVELSISADMYDFEDIKSMLKYVLDFKEELKVEDIA